MSTAPVITIFVRHSAGCRHAADEFARRCSCRKHLRWFKDGKLIRRPAKTRSWAEAEDVKRELADQLSGKPVSGVTQAKPIQDCIGVFLKDKKVQRISENLLGKYTRELERFREHCERDGVYTVQGINRELLTGFIATWDGVLAPVTQSKTRERLRTFLRFCYEAEWLSRIPTLPTIKADMLPTLPLVGDEYERLLAAIPVALPNHPAETLQKVHAFFQLMRWSGLAIRDSLTLPRIKLYLDKRVSLYRVVTQRTKTGVDVSVVIPTEVAEELLALPNSNPDYFFWSGNGKPKSLITTWQCRLILPVFKTACLYDGDAHMVSHRLRDTFAVEMLNAGGELESLSKALGQRSIKTTERSYAQWVQGRQDRLDRQVRKAWASKGKKRRTNGVAAKT